MKLYRIEDKNKLEHHVWVYKQRREALREKYGRGELYVAKVANINKQIRKWRRGMVEIEKRRNQLIAFANQLAYFTGHNVRNCGHNMEPKYRQLRGIFYKYCLERGLHGCLVSEFVGVHQNTAAKGRLAFNASFETHPENRDIYRRFEAYMNELSENQL